MQKNRLAGLLGVVAAMWIAGSASAQQVTINGTYYEETNSTGCLAASCTLLFTPPTSRVLFTKVSCRFTSLPGPITSIEFSVRDTAGGASRRIEYFPWNPPTVVGSSYFYAISEQTDFLFAPGKIPLLQMFFVSGSTTGSMFCKLSGRIQP